jgi:CRP-like cAMP-binding protein
MLDEGRAVALSHFSHLPELGALASELSASRDRFGAFASRDLALEWCEDVLLSAPASPASSEIVPLAGNELCARLGPQDIEALESVSRRVKFAAGQRIVGAGEVGDSVFLLAAGEVSVTLDLPGGTAARLATLSAGMAFGEMALLGERVRAANVIADSDVECYELRVDDLARIWDSTPDLRAAVYETLARKLAANLRRANAEIEALSR